MAMGLAQSKTKAAKGILVEVQLHETPLTFLSCHLPGLEDSPEKRNKNIEAIASKLLPVPTPGDCISYAKQKPSSIEPCFWA